MTAHLGRLPGDEVMRQHMRTMRKGMKMEEGNDKLRGLAKQLEAEIAEHDQAIAQRQQMAQALQAQLADCARDAVSRQGAKVQSIVTLNRVREMLGEAPLPPPGPPPAMATEGEAPTNG